MMTDAATIAVGLMLPSLDGSHVALTETFCVGVRSLAHKGNRLRRLGRSVRPAALVAIATISLSASGWANMTSSDCSNTIDFIGQSSDPVQGLAWSPNGNSLAAMQLLGEGVDIFIRGADTTRLPQLRSIADPSIAFVDDHTLVTFPSIGSPQDTLVDIWTVGQSQPARSIAGDRVGGGFARNHASTFCLSGDRKTLAAVSSLPNDQVLAIAPTASWATRFADLATIEPRKDAIVSVSCSNDGSTLALGSISGMVYIVGTRDLRVTSSFEAFSTQLLVGVGALAISPNGRMVATGPTIQMTTTRPGLARSDASIIGGKIWQMDDHRLLAQDGVAAATRQIDWSPDSAFVAFARDRSVTILDAHSGNQVAHSDTDGTSTVRFRPDGSCIAYGNGKSVGILPVPR